MFEGVSKVNPFQLSAGANFWDATFSKWRVTSVKRWKRSPSRIEIHAKHGLYTYGVFTDDDIMLTGDEATMKAYRHKVLNNQLRWQYVHDMFRHGVSTLQG